MTFDLSWLWDLLNTIVSTMQSWFSSLWTVAQNITNTGQGVFAGLVAFGSQIWDAFLKGVDAFGQWFYDSLKGIWENLVHFGEYMGGFIMEGLASIGAGVQWIASQIYAFGNWVYNTLLFVWNWIVNTIVGVWNNIVTWFSGVATAIGTWWTSVITGVNTWFTNLLKTFRQKIITTIEADLTISMAWKGAERFLAPQKLSDFGYGLVGIVASPIIGRLVGTIVDIVVPLPSSATYPLIPDITGFAYTPPTLTVEKPTEPTYPTAPPTPPAVYPYIPVYQYEPSIATTYTVAWIGGQSLSPEITTTYETEVT